MIRDVKDSCVTILLLLYTLLQSSHSFPNELRIGLLSYKGLPEVEQAFSYAVRAINKNRTVLPHTTLIPEILEMESPENSPSVIIRNVLDLANKRVSAVIGPFRSSHAQMASYIFSELRIPMITPTATDPFLRNELWSSFLLHLQPLDEYQSLALLDLADAMKWNSVALISSMDSYGINGLTTFQRYSNNRKIKILANEMIPLTNDIRNLDVRKQVENLKKSESRIFIMNVHSGYAKPILKTAKDLGLVGPQYAWVVTDGTINDAQNLLNSTSNKFEDYVQGVIGFVPATSNSPATAEERKALQRALGGPQVDTEESETDSLGVDLQNRAYLTYDSVWVVAHALRTVMHEDHLEMNPPVLDFWSSPVRHYNEGKMLLHYMMETKFEGVTSKIQFDKKGGPVSKKYDLVNFRSKKIFKVGEWTPTINLDSLQRLTLNQSEKIMWNGRVVDTPTSAVRSLKGRTLRLGITQEPPFIKIDRNCTLKTPNDTKLCYTGLCIELVEKLAMQLEFDYIFVESADKKFGSPEPNGSWNGLIKMLLEGDIDVGAVNFAMNKARERAIDFSIPFINTGLVMTTKIKEAKSDPFFWTKPFDVDLWYAILAFAVLMVLLIWLYDHMSPLGFYGRRMHAALRCSCKACEVFRCNKEMKITAEEGVDNCLFETRLSDPSENKEELMNVGNSLWMIAACLFSIGPVEGVPRNMSGRVILAMWWFMILIVTAMYTANLAAFLTVTRMENGINSIADLISQDEVKWGTVNGTNAEILLGAAKSSELEEVYKRMDSVANVEEGFKRAREEEYIFFYGGAIVTFEANTKPCNLQIIGEQLFSFGYAFGFPPNSPYLETFNAALLTLSEQNELDALWKKWSKGDCAAKGKTTKSSSLNLANIYGLCYTFFVVIAVSGVILIGEILYESVMDMKRFKTSFLNAVKYRLIYIWKRPEYQNCKYKEWEPPEEGTVTSSKRTDDINVGELIHMIDFDGKNKLSTKSKSDDNFIPLNPNKAVTDLGYETPHDREDKVILLPNSGYRQSNGRPLGNGKDHHKPQKKDVAVPARQYHHNSLPTGFNMTNNNNNNNTSPTDSDSLVRGVNPYHSTKSLPKSRSRNQGPHKRTTNSAAETDPHHFAQELFDRTLERMTNSNQEGRRSERGSKARRTVSSRKAGASLSTRSSLIYSSDNDLSDTQDISSESDVSLPT